MSSSNMFRKWIWWLSLLTLNVVGGYLLISVYIEVHRGVLQQWATQQLTLTKEISHGIERFFNQYHGTLSYLTRNDHIISFDRRGQEMLADYHSANQKNIRAITRINEKGIIVYTWPYNAASIGKDVSGQEHNALIIKTHQPVVSDVFQAVQGYPAIAYAVPVFQQGVYKGSLTLLIPFQTIAASFLEEIKLGQREHFWILSQKGIPLFRSANGPSPDSAYWSATNTSLAGLQARMLKGEGGTGELKFQNNSKDGETGLLELAVFHPITLDNTFWSLAIAAPEDDILGLLKGFTTKWLVIMIVLGVAALTGSYYLFRVLLILGETRKRQQAEAAVARERHLSDDIISSLPGIFYMYDDQGKLVRWNKQHEEVTGYSAKELLGKYILDFFSEEQKTYISTRVQSVFVKGESFAEAPLLIKNGGQIPYYFTGRLAQLDGRQYLLGVGIDITERKKAEEEKENLQAQLLQAQKMETVGRLAGGVAHDFNNMLTAILGHAQLAMMRCNPSERLLAHLKEIEAAGLRSADVVRQLLAYARKQTVAPKILDLNETVAGMLKMLRRLIGEDINLAWLPGPDLWPIKVDPSQIDQLLANLCVNSRDAIAEIGKMTIETQNITFDAAYCAAHRGFVCGDFVMLAVSDDGSGMDKNVLDHIFEPFYTTKDVGKGTGLGLATVYGMVKQNEGFINVYSEPGQGTTIKIYLPRHLGQDFEAAAENQTEISKGRGETILLVEDEPAILKISTSMLEQLGYRVLAAGKPSEAVHLAKTHAEKIHLLMTDVIMPEMNGRDLAAHLVKINPSIKCLFMSGYTANVIAHQGVLDEGVNFIQKPFSMQALAAMVHEVLNQQGT